MADNKATAAEATEAPAAAKTEYIEYLGDETFGTAFLTSHTLPRGDMLWKRAGLDSAKEVQWVRDPNGPKVGQKGNRMLVPVADLDPAQVEVLEKTPGYKRVSE